MSPRAAASFYRTSAGAEVDLVLELPGGEIWAIEIKSGLSPKPTKGFHIACEDLKVSQAFVVYSGDECYPLGPGLDAIGMHELAEQLSTA